MPPAQTRTVGPNLQRLPEERTSFKIKAKGNKKGLNGAEAIAMPRGANLSTGAAKPGNWETR